MHPNIIVQNFMFLNVVCCFQLLIKKLLKLVQEFYNPLRTTDTFAIYYAQLSEKLLLQDDQNEWDEKKTYL